MSTNHLLSACSFLWWFPHINHRFFSFSFLLSLLSIIAAISRGLHNGVDLIILQLKYRIKQGAAELCARERRVKWVVTFLRVEPGESEAVLPGFFLLFLAFTSRLAPKPFCPNILVCDHPDTYVEPHLWWQINASETKAKLNVAK